MDTEFIKENIGTGSVFSVNRAVHPVSYKLNIYLFTLLKISIFITTSTTVQYSTVVQYGRTTHVLLCKVKTLQVDNISC